ncbi:MAG: BrnT family toxin [Acidobacteria bacterium]|nr:BrnT family toxin [Acidobacteriota bacterium]
MRDLRFEWDERKNVQNQRTHGVSFEEAESVFLDDQALLLDDPDHSSREDRFVLVGLSAAVRMLVVCHCYRASGHVIRLISARKATATERKGYFERWRR